MCMGCMRGCTEGIMLHRDCALGGPCLVAHSPVRCLGRRLAPAADAWQHHAAADAAVAATGFTAVAVLAAIAWQVSQASASGMCLRVHGQRGS